MSWVDVAALGLILWGAAQGYINGVLSTLVRFLGVSCSIIAAFFLVEPLAVYLQGEWQLEAVFVDWFHNKGQTLISATQAGSNTLTLPPLAAPVLRQLVPELTAIPVVATSDTISSLLATLAVRMIALTVAIFFLLTVARMLTRFRARECSAKQPEPEWQRLVGLVVGSAYGLLFALLICLAVDAFSILFVPTLLETELLQSYLAQVATYIFQ